MRSNARIAAAKHATRTPTPTIVFGTVPRKPVNAARRPREYLTPREVQLLMECAGKRGRYGHRDATMILIAYRHGLRASEVCALRWDQIDFTRGLLHVRRLKNGTPSVHPIGGTELRALRRLMREEPQTGKFPFPLHPHMLRHACGYKLANDGQDTLLKRWSVGVMMAGDRKSAFSAAGHTIRGRHWLVSHGPRIAQGLRPLHLP